MRTLVVSIALFAVILIGGSLAPRSGLAADIPPDVSISIYVMPPITDNKILPTATLSTDYLAEEISITASRGEYEPATFVVRADGPIPALLVEASALASGNYTIPRENVDVRIVKCWYQAGEGLRNEGRRILVPELLLKDDALVKAEDQENYLKIGSDYLWISQSNGDIPGISAHPSVDELPIRDAVSLQPVDVSANTNKQFWLTVKVPDEAMPGTYNGEITLSTAQRVLKKITLRLEVLPIDLAQPCLIYSMYYNGRLDPAGWGTVSAFEKSPNQLRMELENMMAHGVTNPIVRQDWENETLLREYLRIMKAAGMATSPLFLLGQNDNRENLGYRAGMRADEIDQLYEEVADVLQMAEEEGFADVHFYGVDEALAHGGIETLTSQRHIWEGIHASNGKVFAAGVPVGYLKDERSPGDFGFVGDLLDVFNCYGPPSRQEADRWHSLGHRIFCYANPQAGLELPETYRRNFGLLLWQAGYDGAMDYAYQYQPWSHSNVWNDWRRDEYRNRAMAYPTVDGVIDTLQWEGWREGVDDVRYLTTLLKAVETAKTQGRDTAQAEAYLAQLRKMDLANEDLDAVRAQIVSHILSLQFSEASPNPESQFVAVGSNGGLADTKMQSVAVKSGEYPALSLVSQVARVGTSADTLATSSRIRPIAWSPYESPENPRELGVYLMGKKEGSPDRNLDVYEGVPAPEQPDASVTKTGSNGLVSSGQIVYVVGLTGVSALLFQLYSRWKRREPAAVNR